MSYFLLPKIPFTNQLMTMIGPAYSAENNIRPVINKTLMSYLSDIKAEIDHRQADWDRYKKYTNPYEYIHTQVPNSRQSVCKLKPLSRSFYKMLEIAGLLDLETALPPSCKTFHLAEGPGGFIEAICELRPNRENDSYTGMTLIDDDDHSVPGWRKSKAFLSKHTDVYIEKGADERGDLMVAENLKHCFMKYRGSIDLVTADGGFDFSLDFNHQETVSAKLIFCQIAFAAAVQKKGGNFVIKFFDTFTQISLDVLYLLSLLYDSVYFVKPQTSRHANSEKYVVCKGFRMSNTEELVKRFFHCFQAFPSDENMIRLLNVPIPYVYSSRVEEYNAIFGQQQIESISSTLNLIDNNKYDRLESMKKAHVQKCVTWCQRYRVPYNKVITSTNIFLSGRGSSAKDV